MCWARWFSCLNPTNNSKVSSLKSSTSHDVKAAPLAPPMVTKGAWDDPAYSHPKLRLGSFDALPRSNAVPKPERSLPPHASAPERRSSGASNSTHSLSIDPSPEEKFSTTLHSPPMLPPLKGTYLRSVEEVSDAAEAPSPPQGSTIRPTFARLNKFGAAGSE